MRHFIAAIAVAALAIPAAADGFRDNYAHSTATTINLTAPSSASTTDRSSGTLKAKQKGTEISFTWTEDGVACTLKGKVTGYDIRFYAAQSCRIEDDENDSTFKLSLVAGSGTVDDDGELALALEWKIKGSMDGHEVAGTASQRTNAVPK